MYLAGFLSHKWRLVEEIFTIQFWVTVGLHSLIFQKHCLVLSKKSALALAFISYLLKELHKTQWHSQLVRWKLSSVEILWEKLLHKIILWLFNSLTLLFHNQLKITGLNSVDLGLLTLAEWWLTTLNWFFIMHVQHQKLILFEVINMKNKENQFLEKLLKQISKACLNTYWLKYFNKTCFQFILCILNILLWFNFFMIQSI